MRKRRFRVSIAAAKLRRKLQRGQEPEMELILAVLGDIRKLVIPPDFRRPPEERFAPKLPAAPASASAESVDAFENAVLLEAVEGLGAEIQAVSDHHQQQLSDMVLDAYHNASEAAAREPENLELVALVARMRAILEESLDGDIPTREELEAERWARDTGKKH